MKVFVEKIEMFCILLVCNTGFKIMLYVPVCVIVWLHLAHNQIYYHKKLMRLHIIQQLGYCMGGTS